MRVRLTTKISAADGLVHERSGTVQKLDLHDDVVSVSVDLYKGKNPHLACARATSKERVEPVRRLLVTIRT